MQYDDECIFYLEYLAIYFYGKKFFFKHSGLACDQLKKLYNPNTMVVVHVCYCLNVYTPYRKKWYENMQFSIKIVCGQYYILW